MAQVLRAGAGSAILLSTLLAACSGTGGDAVATVNGQPISRSAVLERIERKPESGNILGHLIEDVMIEQYAQNNHIVVTDAEVSARENALRAQFSGSSWNKMLKRRNLSEADVSDFFRSQLILERVVASDVKVTPAEIKEYYAKHRAEYDKSGQASTLASATPHISQVLQQQQIAEYSMGFMQDLHRQTKIVINDPRYANIFAPPPVVPGGSPMEPNISETPQ